MFLAQSADFPKGSCKSGVSWITVRMLVSVAWQIVSMFLQDDYNEIFEHHPDYKDGDDEEEAMSEKW